MMNENKAMYAVACSYAEEEDYQSYFFVEFNTEDEEEALALAKCICGKRAASKSLVIIDSYGGIWP
jgi:hypothetical protein